MLPKIPRRKQKTVKMPYAMEESQKTRKGPRYCKENDKSIEVYKPSGEAKENDMAEGNIQPQTFRKEQDN